MYLSSICPYHVKKVKKMSNFGNLLSNFGNYRVISVIPGNFGKYQYRYLLVRNLSTKVKIYDQIVIFVWLGTCDLTKNKGSFISLQHGTDEEAVSYLPNRIQNFCSFAARVPSVKLVFLEIPPYSIVEWNRCKGQHSPLYFQKQDISLNTRIILVNEVFRQINDSRNFTYPLLRLDLTRYRKE